MQGSVSSLKKIKKRKIMRSRFTKNVIPSPLQKKHLPLKRSTFLLPFIIDRDDIVVNMLFYNIPYAWRHINF